jgi:serine/threonine-protein kinase
MGSVYEARHIGTGRRVAVKVISSELIEHPGILKRFEVEARAAGAIESQHIAQVLDIGVDKDRRAPFLVMEFLVGEDIEQLTQRAGPLPHDLVTRIAAQACVGLSRAHAARIIHRDVKPANLFLAERDGGERVVKVLDFGIAKARLDDGPNAASAHLTRTGSLLGTPLFMSPEQARGSKDLDARSDLWSLGVVMYYALAGRTPHHEADALGELIINICTVEPTPLKSLAPAVPEPLAAIVRKAMRIQADERYASADEMLAALSALLPDTSSAITASMVPSAHLPDHSAQLVVAGGAESIASAPTMLEGVDGSPGRGSTHAGVASTSSPGDARPRRVGLYAGGATLALALVAVGYGAARSGASHASASVASDPPLPAASAPPVAPPALPSQANAAPSAPLPSTSAAVMVGTAAPSAGTAAPTVSAPRAPPRPGRPAAAGPLPSPAPSATPAPARPAPTYDDPTSHM